MPTATPSVKAVFDRALEIASLKDRHAYLDAVCSEAPDVRQKVERLLRAYTEAGSFLEPPPPPPGVGGVSVTVDLPRGDAVTGTFTPKVDHAATLEAAGAGSNEVTGTFADNPRPLDSERTPGGESGLVIAGRYTLGELIGEGGMGSVYLAEQTEPVRRRVALKLIKSGMDSKAVLARFDAERQALALMDHPNIARIYDGGVTGQGRPFFVMELVRGAPLTEYCDEHRMTVDDRLQLFVSVCQAVQHAHQKGIIHRDLKPGNVLVTEVDGRPTPKVIDFGVAKATEAKLTDMSFADTGVIVGTPAYMSPEQADPGSTDIDTRTDVYALGVMLYELLTGAPPLDSKQFKRGSFQEMLRLVREVEPPRPSTRLSAADALPCIAANRGTEPAKLTRLLQGELDWVVMKALEKDRTRRYDTASSLARDIERYLADEVVEARPPSPGYRLKKAIRGNRAAVFAASLLLLALVGALVGAVQAERARAAEADRTAEEQRRAEAERQAKELQAREEAQTRVALFRRRAEEAWFLAANANQVFAPPPTAPGDGPLARAREEAASQAWAWRAPTANPGEARAAVRAALALAEPWGSGLEGLVLDAERPRVAGEIYGLLLVGARLAPEDETGWREVLSLLERASLLSVTPTRSFHQLRAAALVRVGDEASAKEAQARAAAAGTPESALDHFLSGEALRAGTGALLYDEAARRRVLEQAIGRYRAAAADQPGFFWAQYQLGRCYLGLGRDAEAVEALGACVALRPESPFGYAARGFALAQLKRYPDALADLNRAERLAPELRSVRLNRGLVYLQQKRLPEALADFDAVLAPPEDKRLPEAVYYRSLVLLEQSRPAEARDALTPILIDRPSLRPVALLRARLRLEEGDVPGAVEDLGAFVGEPGLGRDSAEICERRGRELNSMSGILSPKGRRLALEAAVGQFQRALAGGANSAELYRQYGIALERLGLVEKAIDAYDRGLQRDPDHARLLVLRGWARGIANPLDKKAREDFARAVRVAPTDAEAHTGLGYLAAHHRDFVAAHRHAALALLHGGDDYLIVFNVACIYIPMIENDPPGGRGYETTVIELFRQAVALWKQAGVGPDIVQIIQNEPAPESLKTRREYQELLRTPTRTAPLP